MNLLFSMSAYILGVMYGDEFGVIVIEHVHMRYTEITIVFFIQRWMLNVLQMSDNQKLQHMFLNTAYFFYKSDKKKREWLESNL
jgi:hypothetical protein